MHSNTEVIPIASISVLPLLVNVMLFSLLIFKHGGLNTFKWQTDPKATKTLHESTPKSYSLLFLLSDKMWRHMWCAWLDLLNSAPSEFSFYVQSNILLAYCLHNYDNTYIYLIEYGLFSFMVTVGSSQILPLVQQNYLAPDFTVHNHWNSLQFLFYEYFFVPLPQII